MNKSLLLALLFISTGTLLSLTTAASTPSTRSAGAAANTKPTTQPAAPPSIAATALHTDIMTQYLTATWDTIDADLAKTSDIKQMSKEQQADVAYIKQAVADGRPPWWNGVKIGRKIAITTPLWGRRFNAIWDPALNAGSINVPQTGGVSGIPSFHWMAADMDSLAPAEHGFSKGDLSATDIWNTLEIASLYSQIPLTKVASLDEKGHTKLNRFLFFRGSLASAYYGTPQARRWIIFLAFDGYFGDHVNNDGFIPRRPLAAMVIQEIISHPTRYPSLQQPRNIRADTAETTIANNFMRQFERTQLTFEEDKALRDAIKDFATANYTNIFDSGRVVLPNKLGISLSPDDDKPDLALRNPWLIEEIANPGTHEASATKPSPFGTTKPATTRSNTK